MFSSPQLPNPQPTYRAKSVSPYKTSRFSPYKLSSRSSSLLQLSGHPHAHPNPPPPAYDVPVTSNTSQFTHEGERFEATTHVKLDFELFRSGEQRTPSTEQFRAIMSLFPTCISVTFSPPFLIVVCTKLPIKPWPVTVAGLPLYLTADHDASPINLGKNSRGPKISIDTTLLRWQTPDLQAFK
jgi:hypothetical protein